MDFKVKNSEQVRTVRCNKASATVIEAGDLVAMDSGLIIKATATSTALGYAPFAAGNGDLFVEVSLGNDFTLVGTADANFAVANKGTEVDLVVTNGVQLIDLGTSTTDVLKVSIDTSAGVAGSAANVEVKINKPLF